MISVRLLSVLLFALALISCSNENQTEQKEQSSYEIMDSASLQTNPITVLPTTDSIKIKSSFDLILAKVEDSLMTWGFSNRTETIFK